MDVISAARTARPGPQERQGVDEHAVSTAPMHLLDPVRRSPFAVPDLSLIGQRPNTTNPAEAG